MTSLGKKIRAMRKDRGWTTSYLAERAGVKQSIISRTENANTSPNYETIEKIAKAFGVPLVEILPVEAHLDSFQSLTNEELQLLELLHTMSTEERQLLMQLLQSILEKRKR